MTITAIQPRIQSHQRIADAVRFEWTKLRTVRSTWWSLLTVFAGTIAVGAVVSAAVADRWNTMSLSDRAQFDPTFRSLTGLFLGQLAVGVLGVLAVTSEYATGMIRTTLTAVPRRRVVLGAKALVLAAPVLVVSTVASFSAFLICQAILGTKSAGVSLFAPGEIRAVFGGGLYLTVLALFALGLGVLFRHTASAISAFVGLVLVLPVVVGPLPNPWGRDISKYLPADAGQAILNIHPTPGSLAPWTGFALLCLWAMATMGVAGWFVTRRDA